MLVFRLHETTKKLKLAERSLACTFNYDETRLSGKSELMEQTLNLMNQGVAVIRPDGNIWLYNKQALHYSGVLQNAEGNSIKELPFPCPVKTIFQLQFANKEFGENGELLPGPVRRFLLEGEGKPPKSYIRHRPDGTILEVRSDPMPDGGVIQTYTDISELVKAEEAAEAAAKAKAMFLASISHEIRTPLNGMTGAARLLQQEDLSPSQLIYLDTITACADSLLTIITDVLDSAKLDTGRVDLEPRACDPAHVFQSALSVMQAAIAEKGLQLNAKGLDRLPAMVEVDDKRIQQILINYLGNALKFTEQGQITVTADLRPSSADATPDQAGMALLRGTVQDTGIGIDVAHQHRLFADFVQADETISRRFGGTGLGLSICRKLASAMGGRVGLTSQLGQGSTFWFEIPVQVVSAHRSPRTNRRLPPNRLASMRPLRILVAEDVRTNQIVINGMLQQWGHTVCLTNNGQEALAHLAAQPFDLVLLDMRMPVMDGVETARAMRAMPQGAGLPLVAMTANSCAADLEACLAAGMDDVLTKPLRVEALHALLSRIAHGPIPTAA